MARLARVVLPDFPHHVTHRGNRRENIFYHETDRDVYLSWMREYCVKAQLDVWAYCLMTNHVHLLVVPRREDSMARGIGLAHRRFAVWQNLRKNWQGHLWSDRYFSTPLDEKHLWSCVRYIERNPLRAGMVERAEDYAWSSARSHVTGSEDGLLSPSRPFPGLVGDWSQWLGSEQQMEEVEEIRRCTQTGRPCGTMSFVQQVSELTGRILWAMKAGRKPGSPKDEPGQGDLFGE